MLWKCCTQYVSKSGKLSSGHRTGKGQFSFQSQRKNVKECSNYHKIALISHTSKVMLKILQARFQQYVNWELPDVQARFRKGRRTRDQIANIHWIIEKAREFQKTSLSALLTMQKPLTVWITTNFGKVFKRCSHLTCHQTTLSDSWEIWMQVKKQQLELDMEQWTCSKLRKEYVKTVCCHLAYLTYMWSTSWETLGWMKHKLESRLLGEISITSDMQMIPPLWQKVKRN